MSNLVPNGKPEKWQVYLEITEPSKIIVEITQINFLKINKLCDIIWWVYNIHEIDKKIYKISMKNWWVKNWNKVVS